MNTLLSNETIRLKCGHAGSCRMRLDIDGRGNNGRDRQPAIRPQPSNLGNPVKCLPRARDRQRVHPDRQQNLVSHQQRVVREQAHGRRGVNHDTVVACQPADTTTLADPSVVAKLKEQYESQE